MLIHFHGNAEDLGRSRDFLSVMRSCLSVHVLAVEYPGYGVYEGEASEESVLADAH